LDVVARLQHDPTVHTWSFNVLNSYNCKCVVESTYDVPPRLKWLAKQCDVLSIQVKAGEQVLIEDSVVIDSDALKSSVSGKRVKTSEHKNFRLTMQTSKQSKPDRIDVMIVSIRQVDVWLNRIHQAQLYAFRLEELHAQCKINDAEGVVRQWQMRHNEVLAARTAYLHKHGD